MQSNVDGAQRPSFDNLLKDWPRKREGEDLFIALCIFKTIGISDFSVHA